MKLCKGKRTFRLRSEGEQTRTGEEGLVERPENRIRGESEELDESEGNRRNRKEPEGNRWNRRNRAEPKQGEEGDARNWIQTAPAEAGGRGKFDLRIEPAHQFSQSPVIFDEMRLVQFLPVLMVAPLEALRVLIAHPSLEAGFTLQSCSLGAPTRRTARRSTVPVQAHSDVGWCPSHGPAWQSWRRCHIQCVG